MSLNLFSPMGPSLKQPSLSPFFWTQTRSRVRVPPPHVRVHFAHSAHAPHCEATSRWQQYRTWQDVID